MCNSHETQWDADQLVLPTFTILGDGNIPICCKKAKTLSPSEIERLRTFSCSSLHA